MATTFADLEARLRGHDARLQRAEEDVTAIIETVVETRDDVRKLSRKVDRLTLAVTMLVEHAGLSMPPEEADDDE